MIFIKKFSEPEYCLWMIRIVGLVPTPKHPHTDFIQPYLTSQEAL